MRLPGSSSGKVCVYTVLATGLFISRVIPRRAKLLYLICLFDLEQTGDLSLPEFVMMVRASLFGLAACFGCSAQGMASSAEVAQILRSWWWSHALRSFYGWLSRTL